MFLLSFTTDLTDGTDTGPVRAIRQKHNKPLAVDARCLLRATDVVAVCKSLKQAWIFSGSPIITHSGLCIHRKAINIDKPLVLWMFLF